MHYSSILKKSMRPYRSQSPYHKFEMDVRPNTSSYRVGDTTQVDLPHQIVYRGDSCNAEGYLNEALTARKSYINIKAVRDSKFVLIEHIRGLLKPYWKQGNLSRDVYKIIMKKSVDKIIEGIEVSKFPKTKCDHQKYLSASKRKIIDHDRSAIDPLTVPEENSGRITNLLVGRKRVEGLQKETEKGNMVVAEVDESSSNKIKAVNAFKFVLIEHIRDVLKPYWKQGNLSRDAYKIILKKYVDKIIESIEASKFPKTKSDHQKHLSASKSKIFELIQAYVKKYQKVASILKSACLALRLRFQDPR
ncbi:uncharacterized protein LOC142549549 [Primulina tabacum]|uniref:uncharacterized protein LOC142549549 n=1 Tax=Primulina tabacum TaxID=48773 RepID=UPI003F590AA5